MNFIPSSSEPRLSPLDPWLRDWLDALVRVAQMSSPSRMERIGDGAASEGRE